MRISRKYFHLVEGTETEILRYCIRKTITVTRMDMNRPNITRSTREDAKAFLEILEVLYKELGQRNAPKAVKLMGQRPKLFIYDDIVMDKSN